MTGKKRGMIGFVDVEVIDKDIKDDNSIPVIEEDKLDNRKADEIVDEDFEKAFGPADPEESGVSV